MNPHIGNKEEHIHILHETLVFSILTSHSHTQKLKLHICTDKVTAMLQTTPLDQG